MHINFDYLRDRVKSFTDDKLKVVWELLCSKHDLSRPFDVDTPEITMNDWKNIVKEEMIFRSKNV